MFNLDLGNVPIMNTATISAKVTKDISARAATNEESNTGRPSEETLVMLDDAISMIKNMEFYGKVTKPYLNKSRPTDQNQGKFYTLPVKVSFKDKETKVKVESLLRKKCKIQCSTPYPPNLRQVIRNTVTEQKILHPEQFIQVKVDAEAAALILSRKEGGTWINNYARIPLTEKDMDTGLRQYGGGGNDMDIQVGGSQGPL